MQSEILGYFAPFNEDAQRLSRAFGVELRSEYALVVENPTAGGTADVLKSNAGKKYGVVNRIGAEFPRHAIHMEKGSRRSYGGNIGSTWERADGSIGSTNPMSKGKMNTGNSPAKIWLGPTLDKYAELLADLANKHFANIAQQVTLSAIPEITIRK